MKQLSIIIPVFNVEDYIRPCIESVLRQGLDDDCYEIIIINDGTPDKSMEVIADIIEAHHFIKVINQENQGVSIARNNGIHIAKGEYIMFVDSDDILIDNSVPYLLNQALSSKAELIISDFIKMTDEEINSITPNSIHQLDAKIQTIGGKELLGAPRYTGYSCIWRIIYRKDFLDKNNIRFIPGINFEDVPFIRQCYMKAKFCLKANWLLTIYRRGRESSITASAFNAFNKKKGFNYIVIIKYLWELSKDDCLDYRLQQKIREDAFSYFSTLLYATSSCKTISYSDKIEIIKTLKNIPDLSFKNGFKQKAVSFLYKKMPSTYMALRIFYAYYLQDIFWKIKAIIRNKLKLLNT